MRMHWCNRVSQRQIKNYSACLLLIYLKTFTATLLKHMYFDVFFVISVAEPVVDVHFGDREGLCAR